MFETYVRKQLYIIFSLYNNRYLTFCSLINSEELAESYFELSDSSYVQWRKSTFNSKT